MIKFPPYLKKGDVIGIMCPSGYMEAANVATCVETLQSWGFQVIVGNTVGSSSKNYFSGTDQERLTELQSMLDNPSIRAILFGRGGYGISRIIDHLDFKAFKKSPKWLIGYSDITMLLQHVTNNFKIATIHSPMAAAFMEEEGAAYIQILRRLMSGKKVISTCNAHPFNKKGKVTATITGGNLSLLCHATGSSSALKSKNQILFLEDVGEYLYNIDRMFYHLKRSGQLQHIKGLILGSFSDSKDTTRPFGCNIDDLLHNFSKDLDCPVAYHFPIGHTPLNTPIIIGGTYQLNVDKNKTSLKLL